MRTSPELDDMFGEQKEPETALSTCKITSAGDDLFFGQFRAWLCWTGSAFLMTIHIPFDLSSFASNSVFISSPYKTID